jgi:flavin reductase (DIM6/NTAB) family NADH-FMN oxidoreductase RutF
MTRSTIDVFQFSCKPVHVWDKQSLLLTAGDFKSGKYNTMTVGWGSFGVMWGKPFAMVVVRPVRYTYEFIEKYGTFTLTAFSPAYKNAVNLLGTKSGRDGDKIAEAKITPCAAIKKIYWDDFHPSQFLDSSIEPHYPHKDYHRIYFGEMVYVEGSEDFRW